MKECRPIASVTDRLPRISIVTPSFNQAAFVEETIHSVLLQGYPNLEYIVIDGGSTDGSVDVIRGHTDRLAYWVSEPDGGQADAINKGLAHATGEILAYLNSDDVMEPGALDAVAGTFRDNPHADIVYGAYSVIDEKGRQLREFMPPEFDLVKLLEGNFISQPTTYIRRRCMDRTGLFDPSFQYAMDYDMWLRAAVNGFRFCRCPNRLARMRLHGNSKTIVHESRFQREVRLALSRVFEDVRNAPLLADVKPRAVGNSYFLEAMSFAGHGDSTSAVESCRQALMCYGSCVDYAWPAFIRRWTAQDMLGRCVSVSAFARRIEALGNAAGKNDLVSGCIDYYSDVFRDEAVSWPWHRLAHELLLAVSTNQVHRWAVKDIVKAKLLRCVRL